MAILNDDCKGVLRNFSKFTGKHLCQSLFFNKGAGWPATLLKKRLWHRYFPVNLKIFKSTFFIEHFLTTASENNQEIQPEKETLAQV